MPVQQGIQLLVKLRTLFRCERDVIVHVPVNKGIETVVEERGAGAARLGQQQRDER